MTGAATRGVVLACVAAALAPVAVADPFGDQRLFTTAEQRARIDGDGGDPSAAVDRKTRPSAASDPDETEQDEHPLVLNGVVRRPDAPAIFWLGARRFRAGQALPAAWPARRGRVDANGVVLTLTDGRRVRLEPGEALHPHTPGASPDAP